MRPAPIVALAALAFLTACDDKAPAPDAPATTAAPTVAATVKPTAAVAPTAVATATAAAAPAFEPSPEPDIKEWAKSKQLKLNGASDLACEPRMLREWLRVMCVNRNGSAGAPERITINKGRVQGERSKGENLKAVNEITTLIVPVRPGTDFEADFAFSGGTRTFTVKWPEGTPESAREMGFDTPEAPPSAEEPAAAATAAASAAAAAGAACAAPTASAAATVAADAITIPSIDAWKTATEVKVKGSTAAGCETKVVRDWLRVLCGSKGEAGAPESVKITRGEKPGETKTESGGGVAILYVKYVEGVDLEALFKWPTKSRALTVAWPTGAPKPDYLGEFKDVTSP